MLRGPQTVGELHSRTERLHRFDGVEEVASCLERLIGRQPEPLAIRLPRRPGTKESRYAHLLCGEVVADAAPSRRRARVRTASQRWKRRSSSCAAKSTSSSRNWPSSGSSSSSRRFLALRVELAADQRDYRQHVHPHQEQDDGRDAAIDHVVVGDVARVPGEQRRRS